MLNRDFITNILVIFGLVFLQVFLFNNISFLGKYNPLIFIMYIMFASPSFSFNKVLIFSFALGLLIDLYFLTLGINALCCIVTVLIRQLMLNGVFSQGDSTYLHFSDLNMIQILGYVFSISIFYNVLLFTIESFSFPNFLYAFKEGLINGLVTFVFIFLFYLLFKNRFIS